LNIIIFVYEYFWVTIYTTEYIMRFISCTGEGCEFQSYGPIIGRIRYMFSLHSIIDLLAILPSYIALILSLGYWVRPGWLSNYPVGNLLPLRLLFLFRLLKAEKYMHGWKFLVRTINNQRYEHAVSFTLIVMFCLIAATLIYIIELLLYVEPETGKRGNPEFSSLLECFYWAVTTTAVGLGHILPETAFGKVLTCVCAFMAITLFQIPASLLTEGFINELSQRKERVERRNKINGKKPAVLVVNMAPDALQRGATKVAQILENENGRLPNIYEAEQNEETPSNKSEKESQYLCFVCPHCRIKSHLPLSINICPIDDR
jgi:voltage-gated potassium channel